MDHPAAGNRSVTPTSFITTLSGWAARHPYLASTALVGVLTIVGFVTDPYLHSPNLDMLYLLLVLVSALRWGQLPAVFTAVLSALVFAFCFIPPPFTFTISDASYVVSLVGFLAVALATSTLANRARQLVREQEARARAEAANSAKDELLSKVSHELRAPLTAVIGWAHLLRNVRGNPARLDQTLVKLEHSTESLAALVDDLLEASRLNSGKLSVNLQPLELAPVVAAALDVVAVPAEQKQVRIESAIQPVGLILGDARRLRQAVINLVGNAIKFTPPSGRVTIALEEVGPEVRLRVSDTGAGIPRHFLPRVFEPFSQASVHNPHGGLGLGLAIAKYLVDAHNGRIAVTSDGEGRGATFTVWLPRCTGPIGVLETSSSTPEEAPLQAAGVPSHVQPDR
jgi:K+-sensing histidine kinase KdpD